MINPDRSPQVNADFAKGGMNPMKNMDACQNAQGVQ